MPPTQQNRFLAINTALGPDVLLLKHFTLTERMGRLFQIEVELNSTQFDIDFDSLVGSSATVRMELLNNSTRFFNGCISRFVQVGQDGAFALYRATIVPWLWLLTRTADCRIFQNKKVPDIIEAVFKAHGFADYKMNVSGSYREWEYCVQYNETDFNFVSRLMEQEGMYYYFEHDNGSHILVLADSPSSHEPFEGYDIFTYRPRTQEREASEAVTTWTIEKEVQPGSYAHADFNFKTPTAPLPGNANIGREHEAAHFEIFSFPGEYENRDEGDAYAKLRIEELQVQHELLRGQTNLRCIAAGRTFTLRGHYREDQNRKYLIVGTQLRARISGFESGAGGGMDYEGGFTCVPATEHFRSARTTPRPLIQGPQTAIVVGKANEEIDTDEFGRVKVQFHWDRYGKVDENSSCWVRVSQAWAGKGWGVMHIPRIGQEVIIEFLEGDPDRPVVTGRLYNATAKVPYALPAHKTVSTLKSNTSKGGHGYNEVRLEDKKDAEQLFINAQRRMDTRVRANSYESVGGNREETVGNEDKGDLNRTVCNDLNLHNKGGRYDLTDKVLNRTIKDEVVQDHQKKQTTKVAERLTLNADEIAIEAQSTLSLKSGTTTVQGASALNLKAGTVFIEGTQAIHLKCGGNFVVIDAAGVTINGTMVGINSGGAAQGAGSPLVIEDPQIEEPFDAAPASSALPGEPGSPGSGGHGGSPRSRTRRTVPLLRAPEPPPPTPHGSRGYGPNTADEVDLIEVVEMVGPAAATSPTAPVETRRQFVNLPRTVSGAEQTENGRIVFIKARIDWVAGSGSLAGRAVRFYCQPDGANKAPAQIAASLRAGFDSAGGSLNKTVQTGADGWTPVVKFHVSRYGGDKFTLFATLLTTDSGGLNGGEYEVWRKVQFEVDAMKRPSGTDYMDVAGGVIAQFVQAHAGAFTDAVEIGANSSPAHRRLLNFDDLGTFHTSCAQGSGDRYIHLMYVDTVLTGDLVENTMSFTGVVVPAGTALVLLALDALQATFLPGATGWVISATWTDPVSGATGNISSSSFSSHTAAGEYARHRNQGGDFDRWEFNVRLAGSGAPVGASVTIAMRYNSQRFLSGVQIGQTTTVAMRFRELRANAGTGFDLANATLQTSIHESSHAFGLASRQRPDGSANPDFTTGGGGHCTHTPTCVMTPALHEHTAFCDFCSDNLRARKLERINVQPDDPMV